MRAMLEYARCVRCSSFKTAAFVDRFGDRRLYCRDCSESFVVEGLKGVRQKLKEQDILLASEN